VRSTSIMGLAFIAPREGLRARAVGGSRLPPKLATMLRWARTVRLADLTGYQPALRQRQSDETQFSLAISEQQQRGFTTVLFELLDARLDLVGS